MRFCLRSMQFPTKCLAVERRSAIVGYLDPGVDPIFVGETKTVCHQQWHYWGAPLAPFALCAQALWIHEGIENANVGRTLSRIVLQVEQLEACHILGAQVHLDVLFVELQRPGTTGLMEVFGLIQHAGFLEA